MEKSTKSEITESGKNSSCYFGKRGSVYLVMGDRMEPIAIKDALALANRGELVVIPEGMQRVGAHEEVCADTLDAIASVASTMKAEMVREQGFERMAEILAGGEILQVNEIVSAKLNRKAISLVRRLVEDLLGHRSGFYALKMVMVRFFTPYDYFATNKLLFSHRLGSLKIQNPHRDSWFTHAANGINLWIAVSRVSPGNGMLVYKEMWEKPIKHLGIHVARDQPFIGRPVNFALEPGDILLFHGEHFHSSELNYTNDTRYVLSSRFTLDPPVYGEGPRWIPHFYTGWLDGKLKPFAGLRSHFNLAYLRMLIDKFCTHYAFMSGIRNRDYDDK
jgi:hypothetical protein